MSVSSTKDNSGLRVLLCSPRGIPGGICQWTENILAYASEIVDGTQLRWFYSDLMDSGFNSNSFLKRAVRGLKNYIPFIRGLRRMLAVESFDVAHFSTSGSISFLRDYLALRECRKHNIRTVLHLHFGRLPQVLKGNSLEKRLFDMCRPLVSCFIAIDDPTNRALVEYGCDNVEFVPNPLSPTVERLIAENDAVGRKKRTVLYAGHVLRTKGVFELVEACRQIDNIHLDIMGKCTEATRLELLSAAGDNADAWLTIHGNRELKDVIAAMKSCAVFTLPSYSEGFPNVIIESMACGCPIVATSVGAIPQMLEDDENGKYGILIEPRNAKELHDAILSLIDNETIKNEMRGNVQTRVRERYNIQAVWNNMISIWESC